MGILWLLPVGLLACFAIGLVTGAGESVQEEDEHEVNTDLNSVEAPGEHNGTIPSELVRATIKSAARDHDPVTLQGWSRVTFSCEDGEERKMQFQGENGVYLVKGETGLLEHRNGSFVSFTKDSGEVVAALYRLRPDEEE